MSMANAQIGQAILGILQSPIHDGAGATMRSLDIHLGDCQVAFDHVQRGVAEDPL